MKYKLIVSDFDDTILHDDLTYSKSFEKAALDYVAAGGKFVIATGRMTGSIIDKCRNIGLKGEVLCYQGAVVADIESGKILEESPIPLETAIEVQSEIERLKLFSHIYEDDYIVADGVSKYSAVYAKYSSCELKMAGMPLSRYMKAKGVPPVKILVMEDPELVPGHIRYFNEKYGDRILVNTSKTWLIEIVSKDINKGIAVKRLAEKYGIPREETICIGDSSNDVPMIEYAGLGVAVANGSEEAKRAAKVIAPSNMEDGVAYIIRKYGLEEKI